MSGAQGVWEDDHSQNRGLVAEWGCGAPPDREGPFLSGWARTWEVAGPTHPLLNTDCLNIARTQDVHVCWLRRKLLMAHKTTVDAYRVITIFPRACPFP